MSEYWINPTVYEGRPADESGRLEKEIAVYDLLDSLKIPFTRVDHDALMTMEACQGVDQLLQIEVCKNLLLCNAQKIRFYLLLMPGEKKFKTKDLSAQIHSARLSFAGAEYMEEYLNVTPGSVTVLGLMNDKENHVQLLVDREVWERVWIGCHPCINTSSIRFSMQDLKEKLLPAIGHEAVVVDLPEAE